MPLINSTGLNSAVIQYGANLNTQSVNPNVNDFGAASQSGGANSFVSSQGQQPYGSIQESLQQLMSLLTSLMNACNNRSAGQPAQQGGSQPADAQQPGGYSANYPQPTPANPTPAAEPPKAPEPTQITGPTKVSDKGTKFWGDPHLEGEDGEKYDVMGEAGKVFNILSDKNIQYNAKFEKYGDDGSTVVGSAGIKVGDKQVVLDREAESPTIDGEAMMKDMEYNLGDGSTAKWDGSKLVIDTPEYQIDLNVVGGKTGNLESNVKGKVDKDNKYVTGADGVDAHGLLGQTIDNDSDQKKNAQDLGKQGGTVIEGTVADYEVADGLFGDNFKFNRYGGNRQPQSAPLDDGTSYCPQEEPVSQQAVPPRTEADSAY